MNPDRSSSTTLPMSTAALIVVALAALYVLSSAPVLRLWAGADARGIRIDYDEAPELWQTLYAPVIWMGDTNLMAAPTMTWFRLWRVDYRLLNVYMQKDLERVFPL